MATTAKKLRLTPTYSKSNSLPASAHDHGSSPFSSPSSTSSSVVLFLPHHPRSIQLNDDEQEGPPTPPLWSDDNLSDQEPTSYRLQEIRKGKMELMEMIKSMPDSSQELSLNYLVNHHRLSSLMASSRKDEENKRSGESMMRKKKKGVGWERRNPYNNQQKQRNSMINGNFFLNMFVPTSCFGGRRQRQDSKRHGGGGGGGGGGGIGSGKRSPIRPLFIVDDVEKGKYVDDDQVAEGWRKKRGVSVVSGGGSRFWFGRGGGSNGSSSGSSSSRNSGFSARSSSCRSRVSLIPGCCSFFLPAKSKSKDV